MLGEFDLIRRYLSPLSRGAAGAFGLTDDAALLQPPAGQTLVITADALVAEVHFLASDPPDLVARKLLRVNLSDLAAMGARPIGYLLTLALPKEIDEAWVAAFAKGLAADQATFELDLLGGDTTGTPGPVTLSATLIGALPEGQALRRSAAKAGDAVFVSGTLGDAALGLRVLRQELSDLAEDHRRFLVDRYRLPNPRLALGQALASTGLARTAIDVSDGLLADLGHIAAASGLAAVVEADQLPLSEAVRAVLASDSALLGQVLTGGDDYELVFTLVPEDADEVAKLSRHLGLALTRIGRLEAGEGVSAVDAHNNVIPLEQAGWTHF